MNLRHRLVHATTTHVGAREDRTRVARDELLGREIRKLVDRHRPAVVALVVELDALHVVLIDCTTENLLLGAAVLLSVDLHPARKSRVRRLRGITKSEHCEKRGEDHRYTYA